MQCHHKDIRIGRASKRANGPENLSMGGPEIFGFPIFSWWELIGFLT